MHSKQRQTQQLALAILGLVLAGPVVAAAPQDIYQRTGQDGTIVLGNGEAAPDAKLLDLQPLTVGGATAGQGAAAQVAGAGTATRATSFSSSALTPELRAREDNLAQRASQMFHRQNGLTGRPAAGRALVGRAG